MKTQLCDKCKNAIDDITWHDQDRVHKITSGQIPTEFDRHAQIVHATVNLNSMIDLCWGCFCELNEVVDGWLGVKNDFKAKGLEQRQQMQQIVDSESQCSNLTD